MMASSDEKDRFGDAIANIEKVREDLWAAERDRELLAKLRQAAEARAAAAQERRSPSRYLIESSARSTSRSAR